MSRRFEFVGGSSYKFWTISEPKQIDDYEWSVTVHYGRISKTDQSHTKICGTKWSADKYYIRKIQEKEREGYKEKPVPIQAPKQKTVSCPSYASILIPITVSKPKPPACNHNTITRHGLKYKCIACGSQVEFDKPQASADLPEFTVRVRRFFALSATE